MLSNVGRVVGILQSQPKPDATRMGAHNEVLAAILTEDPTSFEQVVKRVLDSYPLGIGNDEYWVPVFEALIVAHEHSAELVVGELFMELKKRRFSACNRACPPAIVGTLNATVWFDKNSAMRNETFIQTLPRDIASMLIDYAEASSTFEVKKPELGMWIIGRFTEAFTGFLRIEHADESWNRIERFSSAIKFIRNIAKPSEKLMDEVTLGLLYLMSKPVALDTVSSALRKAAIERKQKAAPSAS